MRMPRTRHLRRPCTRGSALCWEPIPLWMQSKRDTLQRGSKFQEHCSASVAPFSCYDQGYLLFVCIIILKADLLSIRGAAMWCVGCATYVGMKRKIRLGNFGTQHESPSFFPSICSWRPNGPGLLTHFRIPPILPQNARLLTPYCTNVEGDQRKPINECLRTPAVVSIADVYINKAGFVWNDIVRDCAFAACWAPFVSMTLTRIFIMESATCTS